MKISELNPKQRFSERVSDYARNRPSYPAALLEFLGSRCGGFENVQAADFGAGTGIFSRLLLERGAAVDAVEPNLEMRQAMVTDLEHYPKFRSFPGSAEASLLAAGSIDLITCAQAFHWFEQQPTRKEFDRVLKTGGRIALIWNKQLSTPGFNETFERLKDEFGGENRKQVERLTERLDQVLPPFFGARGFESHSFANFQVLDREGLIGRFFSASYAPAPDSPLRQAAILRLTDLFETYKENGWVQLNYATELFLGS